jgi:hypothetical protein
MRKMMRKMMIKVTVTIEVPGGDYCDEYGTKENIYGSFCQFLSSERPYCILFDELLNDAPNHSYRKCEVCLNSVKEN